ncbi:serine/threonine-protein kinase [Myxococcota bacterium]|nr:serine/threonine-protein kinase [Myxococcota bacterium]
MWPGEVIDDRYRLDAEVGRGANGVVFRARDLDSDRDVAVKLLTTATPRAVRRFRQEFQVLASMRHPYVVRGLGSGTWRGVEYLVMEFVRGRRIDVAVRQARPADGDEGPGEAWCRVRRPVVQLLDALAELHDRGLVHRDLKPGNVLLDEAGEVRLLDFGLVLVPEVGEDATSSGVILGTMRYAAPEQVLGRRADHRADLFSFGVLLHLLLAEVHPFRARNLVELIAARRRGPSRPLRACVPGIAPALDRIVADLLAFDPRGRPASAAAVLPGLRDEGLLAPEAGSGGAPRRRSPVPGGRLPPIGRAEEIAAVEPVAREVEGCRSWVLWTSGEPGIGKSWLLSAWLAPLRRRGFRVVGQPGLVPLPGPAGAFGPAVERLLEAVEGRGDAGTYGELVASLAGSPSSTEHGRGMSPPDTRGLPARKLAAYDGVVRLLLQVAEMSPVALVADELHLADPVAAEILAHLVDAFGAGAGGSARVLLLVGSRQSPRLAGGGGGGAPRLRHVPLGPWTPEEVAAPFDREPAVAEERARAAGLLYRASAGVPRVAEAVVEGWIRLGCVGRTPSGLALTRRFHEVPEESLEASSPGGGGDEDLGGWIQDAFSRLSPAVLPFPGPRRGEVERGLIRK